MAVYFVLGSILVAWGLGLAIVGLLRDDFPPSGAAGRALVGVTVVIVAGTLTALMITTDKEHPREEAAAEAAEQKAEGAEKPGGGAPAEAPPGGEAPGKAPPAAKPPTVEAKTVDVTEKEFSIALAGGSELQPGRYTFAVQNAGQIQHDLAIQGPGEDVKTPLIDGGQSKALKANLKPGKYVFYCTVPGHEQAGMKVNVSVVE